MDQIESHADQLQIGGGFIARQAVFDTRRSIWGYELFYRHNPTQANVTAEEHRLLLSVAVSSFLSPNWLQCPDSYLLVNLDPRIFSADSTSILPKGHTVFQVSEAGLADPTLLAFLLHLREENYQVAITDYSGRLSDLAALELTNILVVDMQREDREMLIMEALQLKQRNPKLNILAKKVEDAQAFTVTRDAGCTLFQGFFFQKPERITGKAINGTLASSLGILKLIEQSEPDISQLARVIQKDVSLSFRLLRFLNSPYFGFAREVSSVKAALVLAGWQQMRAWLRLVIVTEITPRGKPNELVFLSAQRGRFLELTAARAVNPGGRKVNAERLQLLGLFSLLGSIFDMEMTDLVGYLPLDAELKDALCGQPTSLLPWLKLVHCFEHADWTGLASLTDELGVDPVQVAACYTESMQWTHSIFNFLN